MSWTGGCLCRRLRYRFDAEPLAVGLCHCDMCKKATGGPFAILIRVRQADLHWLYVGPAIYRSSPIATRGFCPACGTPLFLDYDGDEYLRLTVGSLDNPESVAPEWHYGIESRLPWVDCWSDLPAEETKERF
jgi:hypothetical protein